MANEETVRPKLDPSDAISGIMAIGVPMKNILGIAAAVGTAFAGWAIQSSLFQSMVAAESQLLRMRAAMQGNVRGTQEYVKAMKVAISTPFPVDDIVEGAIALRSLNVDPFKKILDSGKSLNSVLGDMAGSVGVSLTKSTGALTQAFFGQFTAMQSTFGITAQMIPRLKHLRVGTTKYKDEIIKFLATSTKFDGGMKNMSNTIGGMIPILGKAASLIAIGIGGVADSEMLLKGATLYDSVKESIKEIFDVLNQGDKLLLLGRLLGQVFKFLFDVVIAPGISALAKGIDWVLNLGEKILGFLVPAMGRIGDSVKAMGNDTISSMKKQFLGAKTEVERGLLILMILMEIMKVILFTILDDMAAKFSAWFQPIGEGFSKLWKGAVQAFDDAKLADRAINMLSGIGEAVTGALGYIGSYISGVFTSFVDNALSMGVMDKMAQHAGNLMDSIGAIGSAIGSIFGDNAGKMGKFGETVGKIGAILVNVWATGMEFISSVVKEVATGLDDWGIIDDLSSTLGLIIDSFSEVFEVVGDIGEEIMNAFGMGGESGGGALKMVAKILGGMILYAIKTASLTLRGIAIVIRGIAKGIGIVAKGMFAIYKASVTVSMFFFKIGATIALLTVDFLKWVGSFSIVQSFLSFFSDSWDAIGGAIKSVVDLLSGMGGDSMSSIGDMLSPITDIFSGIGDGIAGVFNWAVNYGKTKLAELGRWFAGTAVGRAWSTVSGSSSGPSSGVTQNATGRDIGQWNVARDMAANIHRGEMIIPADDARSIRSLFTGASGTPTTAKGSGMAGGGDSLIKTIAQAVISMANSVRSLAQSTTELTDFVAVTSSVRQTGINSTSALDSAVQGNQNGKPANPANKESTTGLATKKVTFLNAEFMKITGLKSDGSEYDLRPGTGGGKRLLRADPQYSKYDREGLYGPNGFIKSFETGAYNIPQPMVARLHPGETVLPRRFADAVKAQMAKTESAPSEGGGKVINIENHFHGRVTPRAAEALSSQITTGFENLEVL